ncbi:Uncharacterized protein Fot_23906 [Forsythia ovata]|uniref:Uncharacterized protein n=1 Tax=Forsythia ovata TaxID=205694 RepID=A0ABD1U5F0_9LAMI
MVPKSTNKKLIDEWKYAMDYWVNCLRTLASSNMEATSAFPKLEKSESLKSTTKPLSDSLVRHGLLLHKDKDIRLLVGICFCEIIQILAPNLDFSYVTFRAKCSVYIIPSTFHPYNHHGHF